MRAGVVGASLQPPPPWKWHVDSMEVGSFLRDDSDWATVVIDSNRESSNEFKVVEDEIGKYLLHYTGSGLAYNTYTAYYQPNWYSYTDITAVIGGTSPMSVTGSLVRRGSGFGGYYTVLEGTSSFTIRRGDSNQNKTVIASLTLPHTASTEKWSLRTQAVGSSIRAKAWRYIDPEPNEWQLEVRDETFPQGRVGFVAWGRSSTVRRAYWSIESKV